MSIGNSLTSAHAASKRPARVRAALRDD